ncbi:hypothetical protein [Asticcacaulis solisilvae]|uniref:hypothetical protein n=1 Tax=Asticcacaulis solisilvae TaxID=1217274 RepID=UPI003FD6FD1B
MHFRTFVPVVAFAAAMTLPFAVRAQEVHTLTPRFPDTFKVRTTTVSDGDMVMEDKHTASHSTMVWTTDAHKTAGGYHGTVAVESMESSAPDAAAGAAPATPGGMSPADMQQKMTALFKLLGNAEVTYDSRMRAVSVDNLDTMRGNFKNLLSLSAPTQDASKMTMVFDMLFADITPQSAAALLRQSTQARTPYDTPLPLNTAVPLDDSSLQLFGATLNMGGTATLTGWEDGKAAHLTYVVQPDEADMRRFVGVAVNTFLSKAFASMGTAKEQPQMDQAKAMITRIVDNMSMKIVATCKVDVDLTDTALQHRDCTNNVDVTIDMRKLLTDEQLKANPNAAASLKVMTFRIAGHAVSDAVLVN